MQDLLLHPVIFVGVVFVSLWGCVELGRATARRGTGAGTGSALDGAVFALFGLLIAFTFSGAASRFDHRRDLIVEEANAIGTAYLRIDVAPVPAQPALREAFHRYAQSRLQVYRQVGDPAAFRAALDRSTLIQKEIWRLAVAASHRGDAGTPVAMLMLPALNDMIDITTTRALAALMHPPLAIYAMLAVISLVGAVLAGFSLGAGRRDWLRMVTFTTTMTVALWLILDLEFPRLGLIRVDDFAAVAASLADPG